MATQAKLSRQRSNRQALLKNLLTSLVLTGRIVTTESKAKAVKSLADRFLMRAQRAATMSERRRLSSRLTTAAAGRQLYSQVVPALENRVGSHVRLTKINARMGDRAPQAALSILIKLTTVNQQAPKTKKAQS